MSVSTLQELDFHIFSLPFLCRVPVFLSLSFPPRARAREDEVAKRRRDVHWWFHNLARLYISYLFCEWRARSKLLEKSLTYTWAQHKLCLGRVNHSGPRKRQEIQSLTATKKEIQHPVRRWRLMVDQVLSLQSPVLIFLYYFLCGD